MTTVEVRPDRLAILVLLLSLYITPTLGATVRHVPAEYSTIQLAINAAVNGDTVLIAPGTYTGPGNRDLNPGGKAITIRGDGGAEVTIIDCEGSPSAHHRGFLITSGPPALVIEGLTIRNGFTFNGGGVEIFGNASPTFRDCVIESCSAADNGGGLAIFGGGSPTFEHCRIRNNSSASGGGALIGGSANATFIECEIEGNSAPGGIGGGLRVANASCTLIDCEVIGNFADNGGGVIYENGSIGSISGSRFAENSAIWLTGALGVYGNGTAVDVTETIIECNTVLFEAGGVFVRWGTARATFENCIIRENRAHDVGGGGGGAGGGLCVWETTGAPTVVHDSLIEGNHAGSYGGGISVRLGVPALLVENSVIRANTTGLDQGAGIAVFDSPNVIVRDTLIEENIAAADGGGVMVRWNPQIAILLENCVIRGNRTLGGQGAGVCLWDGDANVITNCLIENNESATDGGGVMIRWGTTRATIVDTTIRGNTAVGNGGGIAIEWTNGPPALIESCVIESNNATSGGGLFVGAGSPAEVVDTIIRTNSAINGGGLYRWGAPGGQVTMTGCTLTANTAVESGGGAIVRDGGQLIFNDGWISDNFATWYGGGLALTVGGKAWLERTVIEANSVQLAGGAIHAFGFFPEVVEISVRHSILRANSAGDTSGGIRTSGFGDGSAIELELTNSLVNENVASSAAVGYASKATWTVTNSTLADNSSSDSVVLRMVNSTLTGRNVIAWSNGSGEILNTDSTIDLAYSNIQGGFPGTGNINTAPLFVDAPGGDYRLSDGSPCIDSGDSDSVPAWMTVDLDGNPRIVDGTGNGIAVVDMGAFESPTPPCPVADLNCDGIVDGADLGLLLAAWGRCAGCPADLNGDGIVDGADLGILLSAWTS